MDRARRQRLADRLLGEAGDVLFGERLEAHVEAVARHAREPLLHPIGEA